MGSRRMSKVKFIQGGTHSHLVGPPTLYHLLHSKGESHSRTYRDSDTRAQDYCCEDEEPVEPDTNRSILKRASRTIVVPPANRLVAAAFPAQQTVMGVFSAGDRVRVRAYKRNSPA